MVNLYARMGREPFNHDSEDPANQLEGNKPGTVIYHLSDDAPDTPPHEFPPRWYDMYCLLKRRDKEQTALLEMLLDEHAGTLDEAGCSRLTAIRDDFRRQCIDFVASNPLYESDYLITTLIEGSFTDEEISYKGRMLLDLTRHCYPVPDFCILTAKSFNEPEKLPEHVAMAMHNLEVMTHCYLGDSRTPLIFAIRCAMPQYIPGLMPTLLNIGVTRVAYNALSHTFGEAMANRVYLSTLHSMAEMLSLEHRYESSDVSLSNEAQRERIDDLEQRISSVDGRLVTDAGYQALRMIQYVRRFYEDNSDLILTFMQGKQAFPSLILQRMVWTIGNNESYPGVLYSRHSRTGTGKQVESYRNIFGEEIMTGDVTTEDLSYSNRAEIRNRFPAVYHFDPLLVKLESRYRTPVTIEFAVETRPRQLSLFSVLQLNASEMTGRAALVSAISMLDEGIIIDSDVVDIIKPYHLRQIVSASIDPKSLLRMKLFAHGLSVLPRTAITARLCLSVAKARELKSHGENVCLCQQHFVPEDTITLNEVDAILSIMPAAIHVVTACRGYGIPALMDLRSYGVKLVDGAIESPDGSRINEGDVLTISSFHQNIYFGQADFRPARFTKFLQNQPVELTDAERPFFEQMRDAYRRYQTIIGSQQASYITDIETLARLVRCEFQDKPQQAAGIVNRWYETRTNDYVEGVLRSRMGDHNDQSRLFNMLHSENKIAFFRQVCAICTANHHSGLTAGSFMIGRFVARPLTSDVWNRLSDTEVAFLLNEYVLYEKYQQVLLEVGETKLARAHSRIETEGIDNMVLRNFDLYTFDPLLHSDHSLASVTAALESIDHQDNTHLMVEMLYARLKA